MKIENKAAEVVEVKLSELTELQGGLKKSTDEDFERFRDRVRAVGFKYAFSGWRDPESGQIFILDGHHRKKYLQRMKKGGDEIPDSYQCLLIQADSKKQAAEELLFINSKYSEITTDGILEFIHDMDLDISALASINIKELEIAEIDVPMIAAESLSESQNKRFGQLISACRMFTVGCIAVKDKTDDGIKLVTAYEEAYKAGALDDDVILEKFRGALCEILASRSD